MLDKEMPDPGKKITDKKGQQEVRPLERDREGHQRGQKKRRADIMQRSGGRQRMLAQIIGEKFLESLNALAHGHPRFA